MTSSVVTLRIEKKSLCNRLARALKSSCSAIFFARRGRRRRMGGRIVRMGRKLYHGGVGHIHDIARFFEVLNGGSLHPDYDLTTKPTSGRMLRAHPTRAMKKREAMRARRRRFTRLFRTLLTAKYSCRNSGRARSTTTSRARRQPLRRNGRPKLRRANGSIYAGPKVSPRIRQRRPRAAHQENTCK